ncbi:MAG: hypothetical protein U0174_00825 [Polyangiaceae bacterium]
MTQEEGTLPTATASETEVDEELLRMPDPPKKERSYTVLLLGLTALVSLVMAFSLRRDVAYAFSDKLPRHLGSLRTLDVSTLRDNEHVHGSAMLGVAGAVKFERPLTDTTYRLLPVAGRTDVWAEVRVPVGAENGRWVPPTEVSGRIVRFSHAGLRHRGLNEPAARALGEPVSGDAWLLVNEETPATARWAVLLTAVCLAFAAWNAYTIRKLLVRVRD